MFLVEFYETHFFYHFAIDPHPLESLSCLCLGLTHPHGHTSLCQGPHSNIHLPKISGAILAFHQPADFALLECHAVDQERQHLQSFQQVVLSWSYSSFPSFSCGTSFLGLSCGILLVFPSLAVKTIIHLLYLAHYLWKY